jgi:hypothetical protein
MAKGKFEVMLACFISRMDSGFLLLVSPRDSPSTILSCNKNIYLSMFGKVVSGIDLVFSSEL